MADEAARLHEPGPGALLHAELGRLLLGRLGVGAGTPATNSAGTGALRHDITRMPRAWASFVVRWKFGITVSWTRGARVLEVRDVPGNEVFCPERRRIRIARGPCRRRT